MLSLDEILQELEKKTKLTREELELRIKRKKEELSDLISLEGAAHLVARELGVELPISSRREVKIENLNKGMRGINVKGRVIKIFPIREFERDDKTKGRVCNLLISDGTGEIRIPLWDKQVKLIDEGRIKEGDVIEVKRATVTENIFGGLELRLPKHSIIQKVEDDGSIPKITPSKTYPRIEIKNAKEGNFEIKGNLVQIFNVNPIFNTCPLCNSRLEKEGNSFKCPVHGEVEPKSNMIISGVIDDGTASMRVVFFRDQARQITGLNPSSLMNMNQEEAMDLIKEIALGKEFIVRGRIQKNKIFGTLEIIANEVEELDILEESKKLISEIESLSQVVLDEENRA